jgi:hypothetical protein
MVRGVRSIHSLWLSPLSTFDFFCRFVYQVVVSKTLAPKELVKVFESDERVVLPPWDPMVSWRPFISCIIRRLTSLAGIARLTFTRGHKSDLLLASVSFEYVRDQDFG